MADVRQQWETVLRGMLTHYRAQHPDDRRDDRTVLYSMMEFFCAQGLVQRAPHGGYLIPAMVEETPSDAAPGDSDTVP